MNRLWSFMERFGASDGGLVARAAFPRCLRAGWGVRPASGAWFKPLLWYLAAVFTLWRGMTL